MNANTRYRLFLTKSLLWVFAGAGLALAVRGVPPTFETVPALPIWIGLVGALLMLGAAGVELLQSRDLRWLRWIVFALALVGFIATATPFVPTLVSLTNALAIFAVPALICLYVVEAFAARRSEDELPYKTPGPTGGFIGGFYFGGARQVALALIVGLVLGIIVIEVADARGPYPDQLVKRPWTVQAVKTKQPYGSGTMMTHDSLTWHRWDLAATAAGEQTPETGIEEVLLFDGGQGPAARLAASVLAPGSPGNGSFVPGNRGQSYVLFDHVGHQKRLGETTSCGKCHHRNVGLDRGTSCSTCHKNRYRAAYPFDHSVHVARYGGNDSCASCHAEGQPKTIAGSKDCNECHPASPASVSLVREQLELEPGWAASYVDAMHGLCVTCHLAEEVKLNAPQPYLSRCVNCHREVPEGALVEETPAQIAAVHATASK